MIAYREGFVLYLGYHTGVVLHIAYCTLVAVLIAYRESSVLYIGYYAAGALHLRCCAGKLNRGAPPPSQERTSRSLNGSRVARSGGEGEPMARQEARPEGLRATSGLRGGKPGRFPQRAAAAIARRYGKEWKVVGRRPSG